MSVGKKFKLACIGAGTVGATAAQRIAEKHLARTVVMVDVVEGVPQGKALDQWQSGPVEGFDTRVIGSNNYEPAAGSELFVVTAGIARKPGMSRDDLVKTNAGIVASVGAEIKRVAPNAIVIVVHHRVRHPDHPAPRAGQARCDRGSRSQRRRRDRGPSQDRLRVLRP